MSSSTMINGHFYDLELLLRVGLINFVISFVILCVLSGAMFAALSLQHREPTISVTVMLLLTASLLGLIAVNHIVAISIVYSADILALSNSLGLTGLVSKVHDLYRHIDGFLVVVICK